MKSKSRPAALVGVLVAAALLLSSCTVPRPVVTFYGNRTAVDAGAELWCDVNGGALTIVCPPSPDTSQDAHLTMGPGQPLQINVPTEIGDTPWLVAFAYVGSAGQAQTGRSELFSDGRLAYTLPSLGKGAQLTRVEVQAGLVPTLDAKGATVIAASRSWALNVTPKIAATPAVS